MLAIGIGITGCEVAQGSIKKGISNLKGVFAKLELTVTYIIKVLLIAKRILVS